MRRRVAVVVVAISLLSPGVSAGPHARAVRVRVWAQAPTSAFVDQGANDRARLADDVGRKLKSGDIALVDNPAEADVSVEITLADKGDGRAQHLAAVLAVGDYLTMLESKTGMTKSAAESMAGKIRSWIKDNRGRLPRD